MSPKSAAFSAAWKSSAVEMLEMRTSGLLEFAEADFNELLKNVHKKSRPRVRLDLFKKVRRVARLSAEENVNCEFTNLRRFAHKGDRPTRL